MLLDGAHNPAGARALARALDELGMRRFPLVFGAMRGKRVTDMLRALAALEPIAVFTAVEDPGARSPRSCSMPGGEWPPLRVQPWPIPGRR